MKTVYIIISTIGIGGAEKRFSELWLNMQARGYNNVKLVLPKITLDKLAKTKEFSKTKQYSENIIVLNWSGGSYIAKRKMLINFVDEHKNKNPIFHFIMDYPLLLNIFSNKCIIYTYASTNFKELNYKGKISVFFALLESNIIDMLDPRLTKMVKKYFFWKRDKILNTPSSFVDTNNYYSHPYRNKKNWLVFLGRFEPVKQVIKYVKAIPYIDRELRKEGYSDHKFFLLGNGSQKAELESLLSSKEFKKIDIQVGFEKLPLKIFSQSKIFFSLQKYSNYPSKSLLEALACGNIPIVTDNGDSRKIANHRFSYYVPENFTSDDLTKHCVKILSLSETEWESKYKIIKLHLEDNFSIFNNVQYFMNIYQKFN